MKVILLQDIKGTGKKDQMIEVSDGYARNFLFPKKLAIEASKQNVHSLKTAERAVEHRKAVEKDEALALKQRMAEFVVNITVKAGANGRLFGSVTTQEIAEALNVQYGVSIDKRKISLPEPIRQCGEAKADVKLYPEVSASLALNVTAGE